jgi:hypothetical protein
MDRSQWYAIILREANRFVAQREEALRAALETEGHLRDFDAALEAQVHGFLAETGDIADLIRFSDRRDPDPALWRDAPDWDSAVFRVAYVCFLHDLGQAVEKVLNGQMPRFAPEQIVV